MTTSLLIIAGLLAAWCVGYWLGRAASIEDYHRLLGQMYLAGAYGRGMPGVQDEAVKDIARYAEGRFNTGEGHASPSHGTAVRADDH